MKFRSCSFMSSPQGCTLRICRFQALPHVTLGQRQGGARYSFPKLTWYELRMLMLACETRAPVVANTTPES